MSKVKIMVVYLPYERYTPTDPVIGHIEADSLKEAVIKMLSRVDVYVDEEILAEQEQTAGRSFTAQEIIDNIRTLNGDGCDYIVFIKNEETGEVYLQGDDSPLLEWYL